MRSVGSSAGQTDESGDIVTPDIETVVMNRVQIEARLKVIFDHCTENIFLKFFLTPLSRSFLSPNNFQLQVINFFKKNIFSQNFSVYSFACHCKRLASSNSNLRLISFLNTLEDVLRG